MELLDTLGGSASNTTRMFDALRRNDTFHRIGALAIKSSKHWTPSEQIEYKEMVNNCGKTTLIYEPNNGEFTKWTGFTPLEIGKDKRVRAVGVLRPSLTKQDLKEISTDDRESITRDFEKQRAKGDHAITQEFLKDLGLRYGFTSGKGYIHLNKLIS